jgi:hypothetical protein
MNTSRNHLWQPTKDLSRQLNLLNGLMGHLDAQFGNSRERIAKILVENKLAYVWNQNGKINIG